MTRKAKQLPKVYATGKLEEIWKQTTQKLPAVTVDLKQFQASAGSYGGILLSYLQTPDLLQWTKSLTAGAATAYDKGLDAGYLNNRMWGGEHRLFDGGHTLLGSWEAARNALPDDKFSEEVIGWAQAYFKDLTTTNGMPFVNLDKADFDGWVKALAGQIPGVDRDYLYDLSSFDALELCAAGIGVVGVFFAFGTKDKEKIAEILGAMGISSIMAANPLLGLTTIAVTAYSYWKQGNIDYRGAIKGGGTAALSAALFSIMGLPVLVELVIVVSLMVLLKKHVIDNAEFVEWLKLQIQNSLQGPTRLLNLERLWSLVPHRANPQ